MSLVFYSKNRSELKKLINQVFISLFLSVAIFNCRIQQRPVSQGEPNIAGFLPANQVKQIQNNDNHDQGYHGAEYQLTYSIQLDVRLDWRV